ncbi:hypothetical protein GOODEAATRI_032313, partial [Goodea atripinnis]
MLIFIVSSGPSVQREAQHKSPLQPFGFRTQTTQKALIQLFRVLDIFQQNGPFKIYLNSCIIWILCSCLWLSVALKGWIEEGGEKSASNSSKSWLGAASRCAAQHGRAEQRTGY